MNKRWIILMMAAIGMVVCAGAGAITLPNIPPIEISSIEQMQHIGCDPYYPLNGYYVLTNDIDASCTERWNNGQGFSPIGMDFENEGAAGFGGYFDGQGHVIRNLYIQRPETHGIGLFRCVGKQAIVTNLHLEGGVVVGAHYVGTLVGVNFSQSISYCSAGVEVAGLSRVGGLIGINRGVVERSYAMERVQGDTYVGGLVGRNYKGIVRECYAAGQVVGISSAGGLVGDAIEAETTASFWDVTTSGISVSAGGWGDQSEVLVSRAPYEEAGWDFRNTWDISPGISYPFLR